MVLNPLNDNPTKWSDTERIRWRERLTICGVNNLINTICSSEKKHI